jgi:hydrogenase maturation protein HypF
MWKALLYDLSLSTTTALISARFHKGLINAILSLAFKLAKENKVKTIVLSGGVFQNKTLFEAIKDGLEKKDFNVLTHQYLPANDGGLALGQAVIVAASVC